MAAPMLVMSVTPRSTMRPRVTWVIYGPSAWAPRMQHPAAVAVHWAVGVRWLPYGGDGDAGVRLGEGGRIIDAVPHHDNGVSLFLFLTDKGGLVLR